MSFFYGSIRDEFDVETAALVAKLALNDLADILPADCLPLEDAKLAKSIGDALVTDAAYLDAFITAEEAAAEDRIAAELLSRGEALPVPKSCQTRLEHPAFAMHPVYNTSYA